MWAKPASRVRIPPSPPTEPRQSPPRAGFVVSVGSTVDTPHTVPRQLRAWTIGRGSADGSAGSKRSGRAAAAVLSWPRAASRAGAAAVLRGGRAPDRHRRRSGHPVVDALPGGAPRSLLAARLP